MHDGPNAPAAEYPIQGFSNCAKDGGCRGKAEGELAVNIYAAIPGDSQKGTIVGMDWNYAIGIPNVDFS